MSTAVDPTLTAKIVEWDNQKGYGFLQVGKGRVFLHRHDFIEWHKRPVVGDVICFTLGQDVKGRNCAKNAVHLNDGGRITILAVLLLLSLLVLPAIALHQRGIDFRWAGLYVLVVGAISYRCYALDKRRARENDWRISESQLHLTELIGGWPGAFLAQRQLRHKVSKPGYQTVFWMIILSYQFASYDSLHNWQLSRKAWIYLGQKMSHAQVAPASQFATTWNTNVQVPPIIDPKPIFLKVVNC